MTTSSTDFDPNAVHQFLEPYSHSRRAWSSADIDHTSQAPAYAESLTTDVSWAPSVATNYTTASSSTARTKSSTFDAVPRSTRSESTAPSLGPAQSVVGMNPTPVDSTAAGYGDEFVLWCEFRHVIGCEAVFAGDSEYEWIQHHIHHLEGKFPSEFVCWFCDHVPFKAKHSADRQAMFELRMQHICEHIRGDYYQVDHMRPDFRLLEHMCRHGRLDREIFEELRSYSELPPQYRLPKDDYSSHLQATNGQIYNQAQEDRRRRKQQQSAGKRRH